MQPAIGRLRADDVYLLGDFATNPLVTFKLFSAGHLIALASILIVAVFLSGACRTSRFNPYAKTTARTFAVALGGVELLWYAYLWHHNDLELHKNLPLHLCDVSIWAVVIALFTRSQLLYEWSYFFGIGGGLQALLTPELQDAFPSLPALKFFFSHGGIVVGVALLTVALGLRPTWKSVLRMIIAGNIYLAAVGLLNYLLGTNYAFLREKPASTTLLSYLGPWPWYIVAMELISIAMILLLYVPFVISDYIRRKRPAGECVL